jgi:hypothetical protein
VKLKRLTAPCLIALMSGIYQLCLGIHREMLVREGLVRRDRARLDRRPRDLGGELPGTTRHSGVNHRVSRRRTRAPLGPSEQRSRAAQAVASGQGSCGRFSPQERMSARCPSSRHDDSIPKPDGPRPPGGLRSGTVWQAQGSGGVGALMVEDGVHRDCAVQTTPRWPNVQPSRRKACRSQQIRSVESPQLKRLH